MRLFKRLLRWLTNKPEKWNRYDVHLDLPSLKLLSVMKEGNDPEWLTDERHAIIVDEFWSDNWGRTDVEAIDNARKKYRQLTLES